MNSRPYIPDEGDVVWVDFDPQAGHEQAGHRPAVVLSPARYNSAVGLMLCCPLTTRVKGYPFEVSVRTDRPGVVLADQVRSLDWRARNARRAGSLTPLELSKVRATAISLIGQP